MRIYNSASRRIERFRPTKREITLYVCGITPYDTTHLGHAFTYVVFDVLARHLEVAHGWPVRYCQNLTDIDDDILKKAAAVGDDWQEVGRRWTDRFRSDMARLNMRPPDAFPGATAHIPDIIEAVEGLLAAGLAYERNGSVYYQVRADDSFGTLASAGYEEMLRLANERGNHPDDPNKDDPLDFVLWQRGTPGEPAWNSPWGLGRPGWHIECSTLATAHLGSPVDIHGGGADLLFPHHDCEIAQAEPLTGDDPWVRLWMHVAMVEMDGEKMSKSLGNLVLANDLLKDHEPDTIRLYLLGHHYRSAWEWQPEGFEATSAWTRTLHAAVARESGGGPELPFASYGPRFTTAMDDDLDTPSAVDVVLELADDILAAPNGADVRGAQDVLHATAGRILGLWLSPFERLEASSVSSWPQPTSADADAVVSEGTDVEAPS